MRAIRSVLLLACAAWVPAACRTAPATEETPMALEMKESCQECQRALAHDSEAYICSYECTFCAECTRAMQSVCPNCGGDLKTRPKRVE
jgi:hypothetical protein